MVAQFDFCPPSSANTENSAKIGAQNQITTVNVDPVALRSSSASSTLRNEGNIFRGENRVPDSIFDRLTTKVKIFPEPQPPGIRDPSSPLTRLFDKLPTAETDGINQYEAQKRCVTTSPNQLADKVKSILSSSMTMPEKKQMLLWSFEYNPRSIRESFQILFNDKSSSKDQVLGALETVFGGKLPEDIATHIPQDTSSEKLSDKKDQVDTDILHDDALKNTAWEAHNSMFGGVMGWGTNVEGLIKALESVKPGDMDKLRKSWPAGRNLDDDVASELEGMDLGYTKLGEIELAYAKAMLSGDPVVSGISGLRYYIEQYTSEDDQQQIVSLLLSRTKDEIESMKKEYKNPEIPNETLLNYVSQDLSGDYLRWTQKLIKGERVAACIDIMDQALISGRKDYVDLATSMLKNFGSAEREQFISEFNSKDYHDTNLLDALKKSKWWPTDRTLALALLSGNPLAVDTVHLYDAVHSPVQYSAPTFNVPTTEALLSGRTKAQVDQMRQFYTEYFGTSLDVRMDELFNNTYIDQNMRKRLRKMYAGEMD